ncbi:hypothetical protein RSSM_00222 [Rhodopirellula sallentina SM41]|uniref:Uncharacterized protein n=1 Tax=Rhodopirellula sallentina SM41 TaxID=1263870 RepID=M5UA84_9BACT|nr:hypothetical protein RSSM_00222 [Rhodopirellula sallentina SM41]
MRNRLVCSSGAKREDSVVGAVRSRGFVVGSSLKGWLVRVRLVSSAHKQTGEDLGLIGRVSGGKFLEGCDY